MVNLTGFFDSPRNQRRLLWGSGAILVVGIVLFVSLVLMRGTGNAFPDKFSNKPAQLYHPDKRATVSPDEISLARKFIETAVARKDLNGIYADLHPDLKGTLTRKQWSTGDIPVVTYEARNAKTAAFVTDYSYQTSALFEVDLVAKPNTETRPELRFYIGLKRAGDKPTGKWLVSYWQPHWRPPVPAAVN
ncbi:MAG TPA: hypothetical protein VIJ70_03380 [Gaiellaceae bacterium]